MTTITATAAALEAHVTAATIRTWCRRNIIGAVKASGRWVIDTASLTHRIAIGARRAARKEVTVIHMDRSRSWRTPGQYTAVGPADTLKAAFEAGTPVTLSGECEGDQVRLGISQPTYTDTGITQKTLGLEQNLGEDPDQPGVRLAAYLIDPQSLQDAPRLDAILRREEDEAAAADARVAAQDDSYLNDYQ